MLGIKSPWQVFSDELDVQEGEVTVEMAQAPGFRLRCPRCGKALSEYIHADADSGTRIPVSTGPFWRSVFRG